MTIWLCMPSANATARETIPAWKKHGCKVAVLTDGTHYALGYPDYELHVDEYPGWARSVNRLISIVGSDATTIVAAGDDHYPDPNHTADQIEEILYQRFPGGFGVLQPQGDLCGFSPTGFGGVHHCSSAWYGIDYARRINGGGGLLWPEYHHFYADTEAYDVAIMLGAFHGAPELSQFHDHVLRSRSNSVRPRSPGTTSGSHNTDKRLYFGRKNAGFPGHSPCTS